MDERTRIRQLIGEVGTDLSQAGQVLAEARIGDDSALSLIAPLGRNEQVREALLRMLHGHYSLPFRDGKPQ